ncbi:MAG: hypothetical protein GY842_16775 [bacterium]|nr:hypothetical protein [bacterium]
MSTSQQHRLESILLALGDFCDEAENRHGRSHWPTDVGLLVRERKELHEQLGWESEIADSKCPFVVHPRARYGFSAETFTPSLDPPELWIVAYLDPAILGHTRTLALTSNRTVIWISSEELAVTLELVDAFWVRLTDRIGQLGG